jgi:hypothetical protein
MFSILTLDAFIVLFLDIKCLAKPDRVFSVFTFAESRQNETNAAHQGFPGFSPTDRRKRVTQYPPLFPCSLTPTNP